MLPPTPSNEADRIAALRAYDVLDTGPEEAFDRVTRLASTLLGTPIALVSLVDEARQWFKSRIGLGATETPRDQAFCAHTILTADAMVVPDALADPRFRDNPLVVAEPAIRFYAGAPLEVAVGVRVGTLCVIDTEPRSFSDVEERILAELAQVVVDALALRKHLSELRAANAALSRSELALRDANTRLDEFAHMTSHDLRSPLKTIVNLSDIAVSAERGACLSLVRRIRSTAVAMEALVAGYRQLSTLAFAADRRQVHQVATLVADAARACALTVRLTGDAAMFCEPVLTTQLLVNLLQNAEVHGSAGPITLQCTDTGNGTELLVSNPVASPVRVDDTVFAPFRRLRPDGEGTGLGLAIVKRVATLHGGDVAAACDGERFHVRLFIPHDERTSVEDAA